MERASSHGMSSGTTLPARSAPGFETIPTVSILGAGFPAGIEQELPVALGAEDRAIDDCHMEGGGGVMRCMRRMRGGQLDGRADAVAGGLMQFGIAHEAPLAHLPALHFKFRLCHADHSAGARGPPHDR